MVSVIMPCYNDGQYIEEALCSLRAQTYPDWELIVIDDGSDEEATLQALEPLKAMPSVRLLHTEHVGPAAARNAGIELARGAYILPLDADDAIEPTYIEKAVRILDSDPQVGIVYCRADLFGERTGPWELPDYSLRLILQDNIIFVTALFRKEDWKKAGGFSTQMKAGMEDYDFWLSILELDRKVVQLPEVLFHYRIKPKSRTASFAGNPEKMRETYHILYRNHAKLYEKYRVVYDLAMRDAWLDLFVRVNCLNQEEEREIDRLRAENAQLGQENARLQQESMQVGQENARLQQESVQLGQENTRLQQELETLRLLNTVPIWKRVVNKYLFKNKRSI